jgi:hypothetical protein
MKKEELRQIIRNEISNLQERSPDHELFQKLNGVNNDLFRLINKFEGKADLDAAFRSWMLGLHAKLKKVGIDMGRMF